MKQVSSVVEIIKTQIDIIAKLEELVASDIAKEIELHKLIESNLWLIREGLDLWSSGKPLRDLLTVVEEVYKDQGRSSPRYGVALVTKAQRPSFWSSNALRSQS